MSPRILGEIKPCHKENDYRVENFYMEKVGTESVIFLYWKVIVEKAN